MGENTQNAIYDNHNHNLYQKQENVTENGEKLTCLNNKNIMTETVRSC